MSVKVMLSLLQGTSGDTSVLGCAQIVANKYSAHINALHMRPDPSTLVPYVGDGMSGAVVEQILTSAEREADERATNARACFDTWQSNSGLPFVEKPSADDKASCAWIEATGQREKIIAHQGHTADLVVVARPADKSDYSAELEFETALVESGRPLLLAPPGDISEFGTRIVIGWNDSVEASRAVAAALPFLRDAAAITIATVDGGGEASANGEALMQYLAWHGIKAKFVIAKDENRNTGMALLSQVEEADADMLVMGAYSHSRLRELIFGGVTRHVLQSAKIPVLVVH